MLKHLVQSHPNKLHTFDDFYRSTSKPIKTRSLQSDGSSSTSTSPSPTSPCSPSNNPYSFYSIFADFKSNSTAEPVPEEDETEVEETGRQGGETAVDTEHAAVLPGRRSPTPLSHVVDSLSFFALAFVAVESFSSPSVGGHQTKFVERKSNVVDETSQERTE